MSYPQQRGARPGPVPRRQYDSRPQPSTYPEQDQNGMYDQGYQDHGYDGYGDGYGSSVPYGNPSSVRGPPQSQSRQDRPGYGPPPPGGRGYPPNVARPPGGYGGRGYGPGGGFRPPPNAGRGDRSVNHPPPRPRPDVVPGNGNWGNPSPSPAPPNVQGRRRGSDDATLNRQMAGMNLRSETQSAGVPERPHTANAYRSHPGQPPQRGYGPNGSDRAAFPDGRSQPPESEPPRLGPPQRSATTPVMGIYSQPGPKALYPGQATYQEPASAANDSSTSSQNFLQPSSASRPDPSRTNSDQSDKNSRYTVAYDFLSTYMDGPEEDVGESDMPNFDAMPSGDNGHHRGTSIDDLLIPKSQVPGGGKGGYAPYKPTMAAQPSSPFENAGFEFDLPNDTRGGTAPDPSYETRFGTPVPPGQAGGHPHPYLSNHNSFETGDMQGGPAPFRLGFDNAAKPPPIRQYTEPIPASTSTPQLLPNMARDGRPKSGPVTHQELQRLQDIVRSKPDDWETQLALAKKLAEAAVVLAGEDGRADMKTKNKNRERYIMDAYKIVKKCVGAGYIEAMFYLADCYGQGLLGLESDPKEAFTLYQSAAKQGHAESAYRTAVCCELGQDEGGGTRRDPLKSVQWYRRAAALGNTPAMYKMGVILLKGLLGQQKNPREALSWLKRAAERADEENPHALHELGLIYESTTNNDFIVRDEEYSKQLFVQAAELGYKFSQFRLGATYEYGLMNCPVDARQSIIWYTRAAAQGEHQSELALSGWYLTGAEGILQQSDTEAYLWARKAAAAGLPKAEYAMGYFTEVGIGVPSNLEDAKRWYWRAACELTFHIFLFFIFIIFRITHTFLSSFLCQLILITQLKTSPKRASVLKT